MNPKFIQALLDEWPKDGLACRIKSPIEWTATGDDLLVVVVLVLVELTSLGKKTLANGRLARDGSTNEVGLVFGSGRCQEDRKDNSRKFHREGSKRKIGFLKQMKSTVCI